MPNAFVFFLLLSFIACRDSGSKIVEQANETNENLSDANLDLTSHVYIKAFVNDSIYGEFLFDTGGNELVVDSGFLFRNNIEIIPHTEKRNTNYTHGVGESKIQHSYLNDISITVDQKQFNTEEIRMINLDSMFSKTLNHRIDGIIGYDLFKDFIVEFNFDKKKISLIESLDSSHLQTYNAIPYSHEYRKPMVQTDLTLTSGFSFAAKLMFDMGSGRSLSLTHRKAQKENLFSEIDSLDCVESSSSGMGGRSVNCYGKLSKFNLGTLETLTDIEVDLGKDQNGALGLHDMYDGLLGLGIIKNFNLILDQQNKIIYLKQRDKLGQSENENNGF